MPWNNIININTWRERSVTVKHLFRVLSYIGILHVKAKPWDLSLCVDSVEARESNCVHTTFSAAYLKLIESHNIITTQSDIDVYGRTLIDPTELIELHCGSSLNVSFSWPVSMKNGWNSSEHWLLQRTHFCDNIGTETVRIDWLML